MTLVAKGNHPNMSFISGWWITIYQPNGDDSSHCSSIGLHFFFETTAFLAWMTIFGWWFTLHESFENGSKWTIPAKKTGQFQIQKRPVVSKTVPQIKGRQNRMCHSAMLETWVICPTSGVTRPGKSQAFEVSCRAGLNFLAWRVTGYTYSIHTWIYITYKAMSPAFQAMAWPHVVSTGVRPGLGSLAID